MWLVTQDFSDVATSWPVDGKNNNNCLHLLSAWCMSGKVNCSLFINSFNAQNSTGYLHVAEDETKIVSYGHAVSK